MAFCPYCGKAYEGTPSFCPNCGKALSVQVPSTPQTTAQTPASSRATSHAGRNIAIVFVLLLLFFLVPVVPYNFVNYTYLGTGVQATGDVSMSFAVFHCGMVVNVQASGSFLGFTSSYSLGSPGWVCNGSG
jgi:hypothetical protein